MLAYSVSRRTSEIGIRMALGARPRMVLGMVLREAAWIAGVGMVAGLGAALGMGKLVASMLYGLKSWDPATLVGSAVVLGLVALGASWIRRGGRRAWIRCGRCGMNKAGNRE